MGLHRQVTVLLSEISDLIDFAEHRLAEETTLHRRDPISRIIRRVREKGTPLTRDVLRARRERKQRSRYQASKLLVRPPRKLLSTRLRIR